MTTFAHLGVDTFPSTPGSTRPLLLPEVFVETYETKSRSVLPNGMDTQEVSKMGKVVCVLEFLHQ